MMDRLPGGFSPRQMAVKVFKDQGGEEILKHQAEMESEIIETANRFLEELDTGEPITTHNVDNRAEQLTRGIVGLVDSDIGGFYAAEYARVRCNCEPDRLVPYAAMGSEDWESQKETWRQKYVNNDRADDEDTADDVADVHVRGAFGVTLEEFERELIEWPDDKDADIIRRLFSGDDYDADYRIFTGHRTANQALEKALNEV